MSESARLSNDQQQDTEPAIGVSVQGANETDYVAWMHWTYVDSFSTSGATYRTSVWGSIVQRVNGAITQTSTIYGFPHVLSNLDHAGDPVVVVNHSNTGFNAHRAYIFYAESSADVMDTTSPRNTSITVSSSNDNFTTATAVSSSYGTVTTFDKPAAAVSEYTGSLGDVYCVYLVVSGSAPQVTSLALFRLNPATGGWYAAGDVPLPSTHLDLQSPAIVIDPTNGHLYISYVELANGNIHMVHGTPFIGAGGNTFVTFDAPITTGAGAGLYKDGDNLDFASDGPSSIGTVSMTAMKYSQADHSIGVFYHGYMNQTHVWLQRFVPGSPTPWPAAVQVTPAAEEQWNPAVDTDSQGQYVLTYYARPTGSASYHVCSQTISANGSVTGAQSCSAGYACATCQVTTPDCDSANCNPQHTLGEYQGVAYANGVWRAAAIYAGDNGYIDAYELTFQP